MTNEELAQKVANKLGVTSDKKISSIEENAPDLLEWAKDFCNNPFKDEDGNDKIPGAVIQFVAKAWEFNTSHTGLQSFTMGEVTYRYGDDYPDSLLRLLRPYRRVRFH